jgi:hypothetical protein
MIRAVAAAVLPAATRATGMAVIAGTFSGRSTASPATSTAAAA